MLKSINMLTKERLAKGGPGSGRYPKGQKSVYAKPHEAIGVEKESIHPNAKWADLAQVFPYVSHKTDDLTDKGTRAWLYTLSGKGGMPRYQSQRYADGDEAMNAMRDHLLTGKYNPKGIYYK